MESKKKKKTQLGIYRMWRLLTSYTYNRLILFIFATSLYTAFVIWAVQVQKIT